MRGGVKEEKRCERSVLSDDRVFRNWLLRVWDEALPIYVVIGTIRVRQTSAKTSNYSQGHRIRQAPWHRWSVDAECRSIPGTDPRDWKAASDPFGQRTPLNICRIHHQVRPVLVVAAWASRACHRSAVFIGLRLSSKTFAA